MNDALRTAAASLDVPRVDVDTLEALVPTSIAHGCFAWSGAVRQEGDQSVVELAAVHGGALVVGSVGFGPPWRLVLPLANIDSVRHYPREKDGAEVLRIKSGDTQHELKAKPDDVWGTGLAELAGALVGRLLG